MKKKKNKELRRLSKNNHTYLDNWGGNAVYIPLAPRISTERREI